MAEQRPPLTALWEQAQLPLILMVQSRVGCGCHSKDGAHTTLVYKFMLGYILR